MPKFVAAGVLSTLAVLLAGTALAGGGKTEIVHFRAFSPNGEVVGPHVRRTLRGSCFSGSIGLPRPDAWRCMVGNELLDPCLESPRGAKAGLVCAVVGGPIRLVLTKPLPMNYANRPEKTFFPWKLVLAGGDVCERFTGTAAGAVQGQGLVYGCTSGGTTTDPDRSKTLWTVRYLRKGVSPFRIKKLSQLKLVAVTRAIG